MFKSGSKFLETGYEERTKTKTLYNFDFLAKSIGLRTAVVDACLPPSLAEDLRRIGISSFWVPAILGDGASDEEIEVCLLNEKKKKQKQQDSFLENLDLEGGTKRGEEDDSCERVLLTLDVEFYKKVADRAILITYKPPVVTEDQLREFNVMRGMRMLFGHKRRRLPLNDYKRRGTKKPSKRLANNKIISTGLIEETTIAATR